MTMTILRRLFTRMSRTTLEQAVRRAAVLQSECTYAAVMADFYGRQVVGINHQTHWWEFAETKQKFHDAQQDQQRYATLCDEAQAKVTATATREASK